MDVLFKDCLVYMLNLIGMYKYYITPPGGFFLIPTIPYNPSNQ